MDTVSSVPRNVVIKKVGSHQADLFVYAIVK